MVDGDELQEGNHKYSHFLQQENWKSVGNHKLQKNTWILINTWDLVTAQSRAWNDPVGCLMGVGLQIQLKMFKVKNIII